jgi:tripartite-type tricarboxylate transporter receptor subunit TctC
MFLTLLPSRSFSIPSTTFIHFEAVANWGADPAVLIVPKDSPYQTLDELVKFGKANPGKVTVNGAGMYVGHHIAALQMMKACGIQMTYIPEAGGVPAMQSVIGGKVIAGFNNLSDAFRSQDRVKIIAIADLERHEFLPDVKTFKEMGYDIDDSSVNFRGVAFPKGVPKEIVDKAAEIFPKMFDAKATLAKMKESGSPVRTMKRDDVTKMFQDRHRLPDRTAQGSEKEIGETSICRSESGGRLMPLLLSCFPSPVRFFPGSSKAR